MEKEDYLKRQIDQLGKVLGELLAKITGSGRNPGASETIEIVSQVLDENLHWDIDQLIAVPENEFMDTLKSQHLDEVNLEMLADLLAEVAKYHSSDEHRLLKRALIIYEALEQSTHTFSFARNQKMEEIQEKLSHL
ncbi:MAG: hypothetical protein V2I54_09065 [Bacteroidales bacterium]|jgi:hypothetical protein|nr:hypothetical protein [Bacteroidales bacterium]